MNMQWNQRDKVDVIVIGAGGAGMSAAIQAKMDGAEVILLEQLAEVKGNTIKSSAGMNASNSKFQIEQGIEDSNNLFFEETFKGGHQTNDTHLLKYFVDQSASAIEWLDNIGITLSNLTKTGGMSIRRTHRPADGSAIGQYLVSGLLKKIKEVKIPVLLQSKVEKLLIENGKIIGVEVFFSQGGKQRIYADAVVVTTGGFGANKELIKKYSPQLKDIISTNHPEAKGSGIQMIQAIGGDVRDLDQIQIHPTVHQETGILVTEAMRGEGAVLVNESGKRFVEELDRRDVVSKAILDLKESYAYLVFDAKVKKQVAAVSFYEYKKMVYTNDTLEELAKQLGMSPVQLKHSVSEWTNTIQKKSDNKVVDACLDSAPYCAIKVAPGIHHTMGGVKINSRTEVLDKNGSIIKGLYAAGETVGGLHGKNRIGGNAIAETIVFGRRAGKSAAYYANVK